jgi:hypothetical protein
MTTRTVYSTDDDLLLIRPKILSLGIADWEDQHKEAFRQLNNLFNAKWYREVCVSRGVDWETAPFEPDNIDLNQVKRCSCYLALHLIYMNLMKDSQEPDGFEREMILFKDLYKDELSLLLSMGLNYDWDEDLTVEEEEKFQPRFRRLARA